MRIPAVLSIIFLHFLGMLSSCEEDSFGLFSDDPRDDITGKWFVVEDSEIFKKSSHGFYSVNITKHPSDTVALYISNFYELGAGTRLKVTIDGRNLDIPEQTIQGFTIDGYGLIAIDRESIEWSYRVDHNTGDVDNVTATYSREE